NSKKNIRMELSMLTRGTFLAFGLALGLTTTAGAQSKAPFYADKQNLLTFRDDAGKLHPVKTPAEWQRRRKDILAAMEEVMGPLPRGPKVDLDVHITEELNTEHFKRLKLTYQSSAGNRVPAYLFIPHKREGKVPAVLCLHPTHMQLGSGVPAG